MEDKHADTVQVAKMIFGYAYKLGSHNLPEGMSALMYTRYHLDWLGLGHDLTHLPWGKKQYNNCRLRSWPGKRAGGKQLKSNMAHDAN